MLAMNHDGNSYQFVRFASGEGQWCQRNIVCHVELQTELTKSARKQKIPESYNFARNRPEPVEEKAVRVKGQRRNRSKVSQGKFGVKIRL